MNFKTSRKLGACFHGDSRKEEEEEEKEEEERCVRGKRKKKREEKGKLVKSQHVPHATCLNFIGPSGLNEFKWKVRWQVT